MSMINEPHWQTYQKFRHNFISQAMLSWLLEPGSLTARLKANCENFSVQVLTQHWGSCFLSERKALGISEGEWANIREVKLICDGKPWVYARTIIPKRTLTGAEKNLLSLGTKPLGHILFEHPHMHRDPFEIALIKSQHYQFQKAKVDIDNKKPLFARRSVFFLANKPLLVSEVFTDEFCRVLTNY